jgi:hypothetical protein
MLESPTLRRSPRFKNAESARREIRTRSLEDLPSEMGLSLDQLGMGLADPYTDQVDLDAMLDRALSSWPEADLINSDPNWDNLLEEGMAEMEEQFQGAKGAFSQGPDRDMWDLGSLGKEPVRTEQLGGIQEFAHGLRDDVYEHA